MVIVTCCVVSAPRSIGQEGEALQMKRPNGPQWFTLWTAALAAIYVRANLPRALQTYWRRFTLRMNPHDRDNFALGISGLGLLLTWQLSGFDRARFFALMKHSALRIRCILTLHRLIM